MEEIDYEISKILGSKILLKILERFLDMVKRILFGTKEAKRKTSEGSEGFIKIKKSKTRRSKEVKGINIRLDVFIEKS